MLGHMDRDNARMPVAQTAQFELTNAKTAIVTNDTLLR
jgi:hypothetical protein